MHTLTFPYARQKFNLMPMVPVIIHGPSGQLRVDAYLDSGATYSIFNISIAEALRINLKHARKHMFVVGDGSFIPGKIIKLPVEIGSEKMVVEIAFSDRLNIGFNLLGRKGVFEYFDEVAFNEEKKEVILRWKKGS